MITRRSGLVTGLAAPIAALFPHVNARAAAPATPGPPTIDELVREPELLDAAISPEGARIALLRQHKDGEKRAAFVLLGDLEDPAKAPTRVVLGDFDVRFVEWANEDRLLVWIDFWKDAKGRPLGVKYGDQFLPIPLRRIVSVNLDGKDVVVLFSNEERALKRVYDASRIVDLLPDDPRRVLMQLWDVSWGAYALHHVDVYSGESTLLERGHPRTDFWLTQNGVPMLRMDSNQRGTIGWLYGRAPGESEWKLIRKSRLDQFRKLHDFDIVGPSEDAGVFLVCMRAEGEDEKTLRRFDIRTMAFGEAAMRRQGRDLNGALIQGGKLVAASYVEDRLEYQFTDPQLAAHHKALNAYFEGDCNVSLFDMNGEQSRFLLQVSGPKDPGSFHIYDRQTRRVEAMGLVRPWLAPERLAGMEPMRVRTRDGAEISAYLTTPVGARGPLPMVVLPHGGPELRDSLGFDLFVQAFAAKGWLVLQPNFRGSGGYGKAFADQGRKRWADRMQEDVEDCVDHLVASGRADARRLALYGMSYGAYAVMMGTIRRPEAYKAAVAVAGVFDLLEDLAQTRREDGEDSPAFTYWRATMGDPKSDRAMLRRASPALRAAEICTPVLLMHGDQDQVCDPRQSKLMAGALADAKRPHEHVVLKGEGHSGWSTKTTRLVLERSTAFIGKHI